MRNFPEPSAELKKWFKVFRFSFMKEQHEIISDMKEIIADFNDKANFSEFELNLLIYEFNNLEIELSFCFIEWERYVKSWNEADGKEFKPIYN